jgi:hypothetical protein
MTDREVPEPQHAELLWQYIEQLKQSDNPSNVQFVVVTNAEGAEVVGLMETAAEAAVWAREEAATGCRREVARERLRGAIAAAMPVALTTGAAPAAAPEPDRFSTLRAWLTQPLTARSAGWVVAVAALVLVFWMAFPRSSTDESSLETIPAASHQQALRLLPSLVAGKLDAADSIAVWEHLNRCRKCFMLFQARWRTAHPDSPIHQTRLWDGPPTEGGSLAGLSIPAAAHPGCPLLIPEIARFASTAASR